MRHFIYFIADKLSRIIGFRYTHLFPSPSKFFLLRKLKKCLKQSTGMLVGADVACADFKYRDLFFTQHYVGVDVNRTNLSKGLNVRARPGDLGILADLLELEHISPFADVLVSSHTIASLPSEIQSKGVLILASVVLPNGTLFVNVPNDTYCSDLELDLKKMFGVVDRIIYGNIFFMKIEDFFAYRTGTKSLIGLIALGTCSILCYLLSFCESIPIVNRKGKCLIFHCRNRYSDKFDQRVKQLKTLSQF